MTGRRRLAPRALLLALPLILIALAGLLAPWIAPAAPTATDLSASLESPSGAHLLGTDQLGRDQLSRLLWAARTSIAMAAVVMTLSFVIGVGIGALGAFAGGLVDRLVTWLVEVALSVPTLLLALAIVGIRGNSLPNLVLALSVVAWAPYARIARGAVLGFRSSPVCDALVGLGAHPLRILVRHVVPTAARPALVFASTDVGAVVLATAGLSFLGLGITPPTPEWGQMLVESRPYLASAWWLWLPPGLAITAVAFSGNLLSEHLGIPPELRRWRLRRTPTPTVPSSPEPEVSPVSTPAPVGEHDLLVVRDLHVTFDTADGPVPAVRGVDYSVRRGEVLAIVGESGSGKTASSLATLGLAGDRARVSGSVRLGGTELVGAGEDVLSSVRGGEVAVVFQNPTTALNPLRRVGSIVAEGLRPPVRGRRRERAGEIRRRVVALLRDVGLPDPERLVDCYPHELSGGMRQRVLVAAALAGDPRLVVADEPTTALDVTTQAEVLDLLRRLQHQRDLALVLISHDLAVVGAVADRILVLDAGRVVEELPADALHLAEHPRTRDLLAAVPMLPALAPHRGPHLDMGHAGHPGGPVARTGDGREAPC
ncbi:dipeptide/oligopeptide/nickel ABC transporter permease/ATP-binding protein [Nocardioides sp. zg-ZUI104]|uniref:dipeptide/oligopeptide/nickel ABC transporter permease/ATP-binding protein n=1 Tax=Nocardioides faecalis TaxID=2803858 RepID=UPI001BCEDF29|nr:dipeptide/oligopeptide/nickel ABC transporter permease/ATP-binding protein [Nocardioides faecalis]MBS4754255.1 dipeptide/oligopeptide/nickel ABC transporter permease/ATP-binding protein [Nocardioides faecalis]